jgi:hypothetical protein
MPHTTSTSTSPSPSASHLRPSPACIAERLSQSPSPPNKLFTNKPPTVLKFLTTASDALIQVHKETATAIKVIADAAEAEKQELFEEAEFMLTLQDAGLATTEEKNSAFALAYEAVEVSMAKRSTYKAFEQDFLAPELSGSDSEDLLTLLRESQEKVEKAEKAALEAKRIAKGKKDDVQTIRDNALYQIGSCPEATPAGYLFQVIQRAEQAKSRASSAEKASSQARQKVKEAKKAIQKASLLLEQREGASNPSRPRFQLRGGCTIC